MHCWSDADALAGVLKLKMFGNQKIPGIENAEVGFWGGELDPFPSEDVVFVDTCPNGLQADPRKRIFVFDHHPHSLYPGQTACSLIDKTLGFGDEKNAQISHWAATNDFFLTSDTMSITRIILEMHHAYSEEEVYQWFASHMEAHFNSPNSPPVNLQKGLEFFKETIRSFIDRNKCLPETETVLANWLQRGEKILDDKMGIPYRSVVHLAYFGKEKTEGWLLAVLRSIQEGQKTFLKAEEDFNKAEKIVAGDKLVVIGESGNPKFHNFARSRRAREILGIEGEPIVLVLRPANSGFQIFPNKSGFRLNYTAADLRTEILKTRGGLIPLGWHSIFSEGTLKGTEPLYFHNTGMQMLMWGWRTAPHVRSMDISQETVRKIVYSNASS